MGAMECYGVLFFCGGFLNLALKATWLQVAVTGKGAVLEIVRKATELAGWWWELVVVVVVVVVMVVVVLLLLVEVQFEGPPGEELPAGPLAWLHRRHTRGIIRWGISSAMSVTSCQVP
ncbi:hypothetical protein BZA05DRAFT_277734 [Tricharina praecox]|uniref:uncharacterized protein n=1 Tax=Tricharina praecox TaxID=43433 RepID=UPI0022211223|nr:uncharacterized protein BZA05DRAFT_277734 [Tricharina praecox]KAI5854030.1 hypothetical protein BZA05DRAFT_277734 [Tricharina praecox]